MPSDPTFARSRQSPFNGKVALVTGASRGIGRAITLLLAQQGAQVVGTATKPFDRGGFPDTVQFEFVDFSDLHQTKRFSDYVRRMPRLDACINNAGINRIKAVSDVTPEDYAAVLQVDLQAPYLICQAAAEVMKRGNSGRIVNIASIWAGVTKPKRTLYSTAKTGLIGLTRALAAELGPAGILVNAVSPGFTLTELTKQSLSESEISAITAQIPCQRMAQPADIAEAVAFLAGPFNTYITGQNIVTDGGFSIV